jgi:hypothetical protein
MALSRPTYQRVTHTVSPLILHTEKYLLVAHLVPGYFAVAKSQPHWKSRWSRNQRVALWVTALGSTVAPDLDVIYNALFRGFFNHSTLWTHSLFPYLGLALLWGLIRRIGRWPYLQTMLGLMTLGGLSHLVLDVISHSTPLLYPLSLHMLGAPSARVLEGGLWAYLTDPIVLLEPFLITLALSHWIIWHRQATPQSKKIALIGLTIGLVVFTLAFLLLLPELQSFVGTHGAG